MDWAPILAYVTGMVDQELLARNEYLAAENRILKAQQIGRPRLSDVQVQIAPAPGYAACCTATQRALDARTFPSAIHRRYDSLSCVGEALESPIAAGIPSWTC